MLLDGLMNRMQSITLRFVTASWAAVTVAFINSHIDDTILPIDISTYANSVGVLLAIWIARETTVKVKEHYDTSSEVE